jgi:hypothetical protein
MTGETEEADRPTYAALGVPLFPDASVQSAVSDGSWTYWPRRSVCGRSSKPTSPSRTTEASSRRDPGVAERLRAMGYLR